MKIKILMAALAVSFIMYGCIPAVFIIGAGAAGATYSVTTDGIADSIETSPERAFEVMVDVIKAERGVIRVSSIAEGKIEAVMPESEIFVSIKAEGKGKTKITVKGRKTLNLLPDKESAIYIYKKFLKEIQ